MKNFDQKEGKAFFEEKICSANNNYGNMSIEAFSCILQFFILINEHEGLISVTYAPVQKYKSYTSYSNVAGPTFENYSFTKKDENALPDVKSKVHPDKLNGIKVFWKIVQEANNKDVMEKSRDFLNKIYTQLSGEIESAASQIRVNFIETYLNKLEYLLESKANNKSDMIGRLVKLMKDMIDESERAGTGGLKSFKALLKGDLIALLVRNNLTNGKGIPKKMDVEVHSNTTIWELKTEIGKYIESSPECMKISIGLKELKDIDNGKTIGEFIINRKGVVTIAKKIMDNIKKVPLVTPDRQLTPDAKRAFHEIFLKFAKKEKMDIEGAISFIKGATGEKSVSQDDNRVINLFTHDKDKDGLLESEEFQEFYKECILDNKEEIVWENIRNHGFRNDLKKISEVTEKTVEISTLPRYILSRNPKSFDLFFKILDSKDCPVELAWDLITRLSVNEVIYNKLCNFDSDVDQDGKIQWNKLIETHSTFRLLYCLQIIESYIEEDSSVVQQEAAIKKKKWREDFIEKGGFEYLLNTLVNSDPTQGIVLTLDEQLGKLQKECLSYLEKILTAFTRVATLSLNENIRKDLLLAQKAYKKHLSTAEEEEVVEEEVKLPKFLKILNVQAKGKTEEKEKVKEEVVDLVELFKAKPSSILFVTTTEEKEKKTSSVNIAELKCEIDKKQAEHILTLINSKNICLRQVEILSLMMIKDGHDIYDAKVVKSALQLFVSCLLSNPTIFPLAVQHEVNKTKFDKIFVRGIFCSSSQGIREEFMDALYFLSFLLLQGRAKEERPLSYILKILLENMPRRHTNETKECGEYFQLTCKLIDMYYQYTPGKSLFNSFRGSSI